MVKAGEFCHSVLGFIALACLPGGAAVVEKARGQALRPEVLGARRITLDHDAVLAEQSLVLCNALAYQKPLDVTRVRSELKLTAGSPVHYKECRQLDMPLEEGDHLEFKAGNLEVGTFYATRLPKTRASLLLIPHRKSPDSLSLAFDSHVFSELQSPQIAVVDAYGGAKASQVQIMDAARPDDKIEGQVSMVQRVEELRYNSVVALTPGDYEVGLNQSSGAPRVATPLHVSGQTKYVVMRVGSESNRLGSFPEELVVFPQLFAASTTEERSSAPSAARWHPAAAAAAVSALLAAFVS